MRIAPSIVLVFLIISLALKVAGCASEREPFDVEDTRKGLLGADRARHQHQLKGSPAVKI